MDFLGQSDLSASSTTNVQIFIWAAPPGRAVGTRHPARIPFGAQTNASVPAANGASVSLVPFQILLPNEHGINLPL